MCTGPTWTTLDNPCDKIRIGKLRGKGSQCWVESMVTWKRQAMVTYDPKRDYVFWTYRHVWLPWDGIYLWNKSLDGSEDVSLIAEVPRLWEVAIVTELFPWDPSVAWKVHGRTCIPCGAGENSTMTSSTCSFNSELHGISGNIKIVSWLGSRTFYEWSW